MDLTISAHLEATLQNRHVAITVVPSEKGKIKKYTLLNKEDIPKEGYYEVNGLIRVKENDKKTGTFLQTITVTNNITPILFAISMNKPLLWICSLNHTLFAEKIFKNKYKVEILRGSLRQNNPYRPLTMDWGETGGSDDEHIVKLTKIN